MPSAATLFDLLGTPLDRRILELTDERARSAEEVAERCDASLPTVYRHLDDLVSAGLLAERTQYEDDGTHYKTYAATLSAATVRLDDGELTVTVGSEERGDAAESAPTPEGVPAVGSAPADDIERPGSED
jgi:DNA-binding transcriptional ArsR family regulator